MVPPVTRAVRLLSTVQSIRKDPIQNLSNFGKKNFPKFLAFTAVFGLTSGFFFMDFASRPTIVSSAKRVVRFKSYLSVCFQWNLLTFVVETPCFSAIQTKEEMEHRVREERYIQQLSMGNRRLTLAARKPRNALKDNSVDFVEWNKGYRALLLPLACVDIFSFAGFTPEHLFCINLFGSSCLGIISWTYGAWCGFWLLLVEQINFSSVYFVSWDMLRFTSCWLSCHFRCMLYHSACINHH